jgi:hypothetical protein
MGLIDRLFRRNSDEQINVFISYRRNDSAYAASAISDRLTAHFGADSVFLDFDSIEIGTDFVGVIEDSLRDSNVCLVLIGDKWLDSPDASGMRPIDNFSDFVRLEIESAFAQGKAVIPVIVGDAQMPRPSDLPDSLRQLTMLNAVILRTGKDFAENIDRLIKAIELHALKEITDEPILPGNIESKATHEILTKISAKDTSGPTEGRVFISYRRDGGAETARLIRYELLARNWSVFLDVEDLSAGQFDDTLLSEVAAADSFLLILSPNALQNCAKETDWVRKEIRQALKTQRNIVPLLKENASRPDKEELPNDIESIKSFNCVDYSHVYYDATISKLLSFLKQENGITKKCT